MIKVRKFSYTALSDGKYLRTKVRDVSRRAQILKLTRRGYARPGHSNLINGLANRLMRIN